MSLTVEEFRDLAQLLEQRPEWRAELRRLVLTEELLSLPAQVAELAAAQQRTEAKVAELVAAQQRTEAKVAELAAAQQRTAAQVASLTEQVTRLTEAQQRTEARVADLAERMDQLTRTVQTLVIDVAELKGESLENRYRQRAASYLSRIVRRIHTLSNDELSALLDDAVDQGQLSEDEKDEILLADLVVRGKRREDGAEVYLVLEVSVGVGLGDVERAVGRAELLGKIGTLALPVVAGKRVTEAAARLAQRLQVRQVTDGWAVPPAAEGASA
ncbi:MAG: hypothetical protein ACRERD_21970 [Candidatus Binatia bacterium]